LVVKVPVFNDNMPALAQASNRQIICLLIKLYLGDLRPGSSTTIDLIHACCWTQKQKITSY